MDPVKLSVAKAGEYYIDEQQYDLEGAIAALAAEHATEPLRRLVLRADAKLTYEDVREILARSQQSRISGDVADGGRASSDAARDGRGAPAGPATADAAAAAGGHEG